MDNQNSLYNVGRGHFIFRNGNSEVENWSIVDKKSGMVGEEVDKVIIFEIAAVGALAVCQSQ